MQAKAPERIEVRRRGDGDPAAFEVLVTDKAGETRHNVTLARVNARRQAPQQAPERLIEAAFRFLLDREPKEQILARFDVIERYFPEFARELRNYLKEG